MIENKKTSLGNILLYIFSSVSVLLLIYFIIIGNIVSYWIVTIAYFSFLFPLFIEEYYKIKIRDSVIVLYSIFMFVSLILAETVEYFHAFWWLDGGLHFYFGIVFTFILYYIFSEYCISKKTYFTFFIMSILAISITSFVAVLWEIFEYVMDIYFNYNMQKTGIVDTMNDFILTTIGSFLTVIYFKFKSLNLKLRSKKK